MKRLIILGLIAGFSFVGCTQANVSPKSNAVTPTASSTTETVGDLAELMSGTGSQIEIRSEPSQKARVLSKSPEGDEVRALNATRDSENRVWYNIRLSSGVNGWVGGQFLRFISDRNGAARPYVVMPGETWVYAKPSGNSPQIGQVRGGEVISTSRQVNENGNTWLYTGKGWVSGEFLFQPTCILFDGYSLMVVKVGGTQGFSEPSNQAKVVTRFQGGETIYPTRRLTNAAGEWLNTERGWVKGESLFPANCQSP